MFLINFNQWKCACVGINNWVMFSVCTFLETEDWVRWGYLTRRIVLPLCKYGNFAVVLTADKTKVSKYNTIITQPCLETKEYYFTWQLTTLRSDSSTWRQTAWHLPLFQSAVSCRPCKLFQCITVTSVFNMVLELSCFSSQAVSHLTTMLFIAH